MSNELPGRFLERLAKACAPETRDRVLLPVVADLQREWSEHPSRLARSLIRIRASLAFLYALAWCGVHAAVEGARVPPSRAVVARAATIYTVTVIVAIVVESALFAALGRDVGLARIVLLGVTLGAVVATAPALAWMQRRRDVMWVGLIAMVIAATTAQGEGTLSGLTVGVIVLMLVLVAGAATGLPDLRWHALLWCGIAAAIVFGAQFNARPSSRLWQWRTPLPFAVAAVTFNAIAIAVRIGMLRIGRSRLQQ